MSLTVVVERTGLEIATSLESKQLSPSTELYEELLDNENVHRVKEWPPGR